MWPTEARLSEVGRTIAVAGSARISVTRASLWLCSGGRVAIDDEERQPLEAALQVGEPPQRRAVGPVQVVDRDHRRPAERDVCGEPVEAVQHRERDVGLVLVGARRAGRRRRGAPRGRRRRRGARAARRSWPRRAPARRAAARRRTRSPARARRRAPRGRRRRSARRSPRASRRRRVLPMPARPSIAIEPPDPGGRRLDVGVEGGELAFALEQGRALRPGRGGARAACPEGREPVGEPLADELEDRLGPVEPGDAGLAELAQPDAAPQLVLDERGRRPRDEDLPAVPEVADAGRLVDGEADVPVAVHGRLARVEPHADADVPRPRASRGRRARTAPRRPPRRPCPRSGRRRRTRRPGGRSRRPPARRRPRGAACCAARGAPRSARGRPASAASSTPRCPRRER